MTDIKAVVNGNIVLEDGIIYDGTLLISDNEIMDFGRKSEIEFPDGAEIIDAKGAYVGPGFVDIHIHGVGADTTTYFDAKEAEKYLLKNGTTSFLATPYYSQKFETFADAIRNAREAMKEVKTLKGLYLEGPYINVNYGAFSHLNPWRHPIDANEYKAFVDEAGTLAKVWTIAPEREGLVPFLEYAREVNPNTVFAVGHSEATPKQIWDLGKYRPTLQTHSMCATGTLPVPKGLKSSGPDEYCFSKPDVYCELISDSRGIHVSPELQRMLIQIKGVHRIVLISDSTCAAKTFPAPPRWADVKDLNFDDHGDVAGSKLTLALACRNIMSHTNCGISQAFIMASLNPAKVIGLDKEIGSIEKGKKADLVFVDDVFNVKKVMLDGKLC